MSSKALQRSVRLHVGSASSQTHNNNTNPSGFHNPMEKASNTEVETALLIENEGLGNYFGG
jgi:hypothetical protein